MHTIAGFTMDDVEGISLFTAYQTGRMYARENTALPIRNFGCYPFSYCWCGRQSKMAMVFIWLIC
ncbi:MAG: hypothetical protein ACLR2G_11195 [Phascolarctobacterium faecium]